MQQGQKVRHDVVHAVGDEHLVAVELNLVLADFHLILDLREIEDTRQVEGIVHVQVNVEERVLPHRIEGAVELVIVLFLQLGGLAGPQGLDGIDDIVLFGIHIFSVFPLLLLAEDDRHGHKLAVFVQQFLDAALGGKFAFILIDKQGDAGSPVLFVALSHLVFGGTVATPTDGLRAILPGKGVDGDLLGDHKGGIEAQAEMADDAANLVLVFFEEFARAGEGNLVDVAIEFVFGHTDTVVNHLEGFGGLVQFNAHFQVVERKFEVARICQGLHLLLRIHGVGDQLAQENLVIRVEEFLDDRENIFGGHSNSTFVAFHIYFIFICLHHSVRPSPSVGQASKNLPAFVRTDRLISNVIPSRRN